MRVTHTPLLLLLRLLGRGKAVAVDAPSLLLSLLWPGELASSSYSLERGSRAHLCLLFLLLLLLAGDSQQPCPYSIPGWAGDYYLGEIQRGVTWSQAEARAVEKGAYLAEITSQGENQELLQILCRCEHLVR